MAIESVSITEGSGKDIAVDTIGSIEYQVVKIALGADGAFDLLIDSGQQLSAASLPVVLASDHSDIKVTLDSEAVTLAANSGTDIGDVDVTSVAAGENHLGQVGGESDIIEITLSLDTGGAYADGDVLAATQEIANAVRVNAGTGILHSIIVLDKDDQAQALDLVFLQTNVGIGTENSAVSVTDSNTEEILGVVEVGSNDYVDLVASQIVTKSNVGIVLEAAAGSTSLYVAAISRGTGTYTASGITLKLGILQD